MHQCLFLMGPLSYYLFLSSEPDSSAPEGPHSQAKWLELNFRLKWGFKVLHLIYIHSEIAQNENKRFEDRV